MVAVTARAVEVAELGALEGELVAVAALRPGEELDEPAPAAGPRGGARARADGRRRPRRPCSRRSPCRAAAPAAPAQGTLDFDGSFRGPLTVAAYAGDEVLVARGGDARRVRARARRPPGGGPRLEDPGDGGRALRRAPARSRHHGRRLPDRPGPARLPARRAGRRGRARRGGGRAPTAWPSGPCSRASWPSASASGSRRTGSPGCSRRSSCRWWTCSWRWSGPA